VPPVGVPHPLVAPLDLAVEERALDLVTGGAGVAALLGGRLGAARHRALCTVPYVHAGVPAVAALLDALAAASERGADARLLLGSVPAPGELAGLRARGLAVRVMDPARSTTGHAKGAVVDAAAVVGSANWSRAGLGANLEAAIAVDHAAAADYYAAAFERDWAVSS
jgi:cardiolipin synthase A/B